MVSLTAMRAEASPRRSTGRCRSGTRRLMPPRHGSTSLTPRVTHRPREPCMSARSRRDPGDQFRTLGLGLGLGSGLEHGAYFRTLGLRLRLGVKG